MLLLTAVVALLIGCSSESSNDTRDAAGEQQGSEKDATTDRLVVSTGDGNFKGRVGTAGFPAAVHRIEGAPREFIEHDVDGDVEVRFCAESKVLAQHLVDNGAAADIALAETLLADPDEELELFNDGVENRPDVGLCMPASNSLTLLYAAEGSQSFVVIAYDDPEGLDPIEYSIRISGTGYTCDDAKAGQTPPQAVADDYLGGDQSTGDLPAEIYDAYCEPSDE